MQEGKQSMRIIIYTGKGGVGKTSMAAAAAAKAAKDGRRVIVMSTDAAHSLGDSFDRNIGREPVEVAPDLYAVEIDTVYESEKSWGSIREYFEKLLTARGGSGIEAEELLVFPGFEELFSMFRILDIYESGDYDTVVVDCAPTGETLSLLKYPERLSGFLKKLLPVERLAVKTVGRLIEKTMKVPMPGDRVFDEIEGLVEKMKRLQKLLKNHDVVSLRVVTTPEKIVIREARHNFTCLYLYGYNVDAVIVNQLYPARAMEGYFHKWIRLQEEGLTEIQKSFGQVPQFYVERKSGELRTLEMLTEVGEQMFDKCRPDDILFRQSSYEADREEGTLKIRLPFAKKEELRLEQNGEELLVGVGNELRRFPCPKEFAGLEITGAKFREEDLTIQFGQPSDKKSKIVSK